MYDVVWDIKVEFDDGNLRFVWFLMLIWLEKIFEGRRGISGGMILRESW